MQLATATRNASAAAAVALLDAGSAAGKLEICAADGTTILAVFTLEDPAFDAPATGTAAADGLPKTVSGLAAAGSGTNAAVAIARDSDDNEVYRASVSGTDGSGEVVLQQTGTSISEGQDVTLASHSYTQPAGSV